MSMWLPSTETFQAPSRHGLCSAPGTSSPGLPGYYLFITTIKHSWVNRKISRFEVKHGEHEGPDSMTWRANRGPCSVVQLCSRKLHSQQLHWILQSSSGFATLMPLVNATKRLNTRLAREKVCNSPLPRFESNMALWALQRRPSQLSFSIQTNIAKFLCTQKLEWVR